jgi:urease accessory protein
MIRALRLALALPLALLATPALAHLDHNEHGSFLAGLTHPVFGLDHVLAMIGVGLWGATLGDLARWSLATSFVVYMIFGFLLGAVLTLPFVEEVILASVFILGLVVALRLRPPLVVAVPIVGLFGFFHGNAHGAEVGEADAILFALGFVLATAILHGAGILVAWGYSKGREVVVRTLGWGTLAGGVWLSVGL